MFFARLMTILVGFDKDRIFGFSISFLPAAFSFFLIITSKTTTKILDFFYTALLLGVDSLIGRLVINPSAGLFGVSRSDWLTKRCRMLPSRDDAE